MDSMLILNLLRNRAYNKPDHFPMWVSQWAHQMFLWGWISYTRYVAIQDFMYNHE